MESPIMKLIFGQKDLQFLKDAYKAANGKDLTHDEEISQLSSWQKIQEMYVKLLAGCLEIEIPHEAAIPKNDGSGENRIVVVGGHIERFLCPAIARAVNKLLPELTHPRCKSYQEGIGTGVVVKELSKEIVKVDGNIVGGKYDFHHYFDTVLKKWVFYFLDLIEEKLGEEKGTDPALNYVRAIYSNDWIIDINGNKIQRWSGIRQGNAMGCVLANILLYELDDFMSKKYPFYVRYSDDLIVVTKDVDGATKDICNIVKKYGVELNLKKTETLTKDKYFKFLGFSIRGASISISKGRLHDFVIGIRKCCHYKNSYNKAIKNVIKYLYNPYGEYSWASSILPVINCKEDLETMNSWVMDNLRALKYKRTHHDDVGGLGYELNKKVGVVTRGRGTSVTTCRNKMPQIDGYLSLEKMRKALITNKAVYQTMVRTALR